MSAAAAFKMDPAARGLRPETPDPDFPEFLDDRGFDYSNIEIDKLESLWKEYCQEADTEDFDSLYEKREAYSHARPTPSEGRYNFGGFKDKARYAGETMSSIAGYVSGAVFSGILMTAPSISVTILDSINDRLKSREDYSASKPQKA